MSENGTFLLVSLDRSIPEESSKNRCNTSRVQSLELYCYPGFKCRGPNRVCLWLYDERNESVGGLRRPINPQRSNTMAPPDRHRSARPGSGLSLSVLGESTREIFFFFFFFFVVFPPFRSPPRADSLLVDMTRWKQPFTKVSALVPRVCSTETRWIETGWNGSSVVITVWSCFTRDRA